MRTNPLFLFGEGKIESLSSIIRERRIGKILLITGGASFEDSGIKNIVEPLLVKAGAEWERIAVPGEPSPELINTSVEENKKRNIDAVIAVGGGSVMDAGKAISAMIPAKRKIEEYLEGIGSCRATGEKIFCVAVPTTAGTGSEATKNAVISRVGPGGFKKSLRHDNYVPDIALVDPILTMGCPSDITAFSGLDAVTQLIESYVSSNSNPYTDSIVTGALMGAGTALERAVENGKNDTEARSRMSYAAFVSGVALANAGLGVVHGIAGTLGGLYPIPHGALCGSLLCEASKVIINRLFNSEGELNEALLKYARAGVYLTGDEKGSIEENCESLIRLLENWTEKFNPPRLSSFGITESEILNIAQQCGIKDTPVGLETGNIAEILRRRL